MYTKVTTLTDFILEKEQKFQQATGSLTILLTQIENAAKIIASHVKKTGLVDILGSTGQKNIYSEEVQKLDKFANDLLVDTLKTSGQVWAIASEELDKPVFTKKNTGHYGVFLDPLDGSSNIEVNINLATIFSIYQKSDRLLQPGKNQVVAGYILYGPSVMLVLSLAQTVNGFTLDPSIGSFLLSHPNIKIPQKGQIYTLNESYYNLFFDYQKKYLNFIKTEDKASGRPYNLRLAACMVAEIHRILMHGGIFMYPENKKRPNGKLRLMYEVNPMSKIVADAGGAAVSAGQNPLNIVPQSLDQRVPIAIGSKININEFVSFFKND